jgi:hypothetical protein
MHYTTSYYASGNIVAFLQILFDKIDTVVFRFTKTNLNWLEKVIDRIAWRYRQIHNWNVITKGSGANSRHLEFLKSNMSIKTMIESKAIA